MTETWKPYKDAHEVSDTGLVRTKDGVMIPIFDFGGTPGKRYRGAHILGKNHYVHRLICEAFHGPCPSDKNTVDHIDRDRTNNHPSNLKWASRTENNLNRGFRTVCSATSKSKEPYIREYLRKNVKGEDVKYFSVKIDRHDLKVFKHFKSKEEAVKYRDEQMKAYNEKLVLAHQKGDSPVSPTVPINEVRIEISEE